VERHLERVMLEAAGPYEELTEDEAIEVIDRFALQHRLPNEVRRRDRDSVILLNLLDDLAHAARILGTYGIDVEVVGIPAA
jgi:hypothetical protein